MLGYLCISFCRSSTLCATSTAVLWLCFSFLVGDNQNFTFLHSEIYKRFRTITLGTVPIDPNARVRDILCPGRVAMDMGSKELDHLEIGQDVGSGELYRL